MSDKSSQPVIRHYEADDRSQVRDIAFQTGYMGESIDWQWRHQESWSEIVTGYYTDREPESASVVEIGGKVVGYLLGCKNTEEAPDPGMVGLQQTLRHGLALRTGTAGFIWRTAADTIADTTLHRVKQSELRLNDSRWPAHFHINLLSEARGQGIGSQLVKNWLEELDEHDISGCHLQTLTESTASNSIKFFEAHGFRRLGRATLLPGMRSHTGGRIRDQKMVIDISKTP